MKRAQDSIGLVWSVVRTFHPSSPDVAWEWFGEGCLGLVRAAKKFRKDGGMAWTGFAAFHIKAAVVECIRREDRLGRVARKRVREHPDQADLWMLRAAAPTLPVNQRTPDERRRGSLRRIEALEEMEWLCERYRLTPRERLLVRLLVVEGMSLREAAYHMGSSLAAAKSLRQRIRLRAKGPCPGG